MFDRLRGLLVLVLTPILAGLVSLAALVLMLVFRRSASEVQFLPRAWGRLIVRLSGVRVRVLGAENLRPDRTYIFAANHQSQFDIFVLQGFLGHDFRWMAKLELFQIPVFGQAMRYSGSIPVDRSHSRKAVRSLDEAARRIADGTSVVIFPEGTRSPDGTLLPFKAGAMVLAIKAGVELVPVALCGTHQVLPKGSLLARSGAVEIRFGTPIATEGYSVKDKQLLADLLHERVAALLAEKM